MIQNKYPGAMQNGEGNASQLSTNDTAIAPMFGYTKDKASFYMGEIHEFENNVDLLGIYGYYNSKKIFLVSEQGRIYINGTYAPNDLTNECLAELKNVKLENISINNTSFDPATFVPQQARNASYATSANYAASANIASKYLNDSNAQVSINTKIKELENKIAQLQEQIDNL